MHDELERRSRRILEDGAALYDELQFRRSFANERAREDEEFIARASAAHDRSYYLWFGIREVIDGILEGSIADFEQYSRRIYGPESRALHPAGEWNAWAGDVHDRQRAVVEARRSDDDAALEAIVADGERRLREYEAFAEDGRELLAEYVRRFVDVDEV